MDGIKAAMQDIALDHLDFSALISPGDGIIWSQGSGEPTPLLERLIAQSSGLGGVKAFVGSSTTGVLRPEHAADIAMTGLGAVGTTRALCKAGVLDIVPCHISELPLYFAERRIPIDVAIVQISGPGADGTYGYGPVNMYMEAAIGTARLVIGELNAMAPRTVSRRMIAPERVDVIVRTSRPLAANVQPEMSDRDRAIAEHVCRFIGDGAVLQVGIGGVPGAVLSRLGDRRDLGVHSGVIGDAVLDLIEGGAVTNGRKAIDAGKTVGGMLQGTQRLYDFADRNADVLVEPVAYTHDPQVISRLEGFIALNSAIEVDLTGQINSEVIGRDYAGTIGGQSDFIRGALAARGGRSIIALPALAGRGQSRIVANLNGGIVTGARADADIVATEYGAAELRGRSIRERVKAMIAIADPSVREELDRQSRELVAGL
jgi:acyl-CoA hydrolase